MKLRKDDPVYFESELIKLLESATENGIFIRYSKLPYVEKTVVWFSNEIGETTAVQIDDEKIKRIWEEE